MSLEVNSLASDLHIAENFKIFENLITKLPTLKYTWSLPLTTERWENGLESTCLN